jgi:hypothetical protein
VKDDTTETKSKNMNTNQAENVIDEESHQTKPMDKKPEGNTMKRVVAVENRVNDKLNLLVVRKDMEESQPECLEQYQLDILKKSQPNCLMQSQPDCLEQSQSDCQKQTVERKLCGEMTMECMRCDADPKEEPENLVPEPVRAPKSVPPDDTHADSDDNDEVSNVGCEANKFITSSGTGPLYKYLRYETPTTVGAVTEVDVFDTGGTMKTVDNLDVSSKHDDPNKPDVFSNQDVTSGTGPLYKYLRFESLTAKLSALDILDSLELKNMTTSTMSRSHASTMQMGKMSGKMSRKMSRKMLMHNVQHLTLLYDSTRMAGIYKVDGDDDTKHNDVQVGHDVQVSSEDTDLDDEGVEAVENDIGGEVHVLVTGETYDDHDGVADEAENIGGGASREILEKEKIPPDNKNPPDIKPTVNIISQEHIESAERFGADRRQQIGLRSMMLPREERSSNFVKKLARKFAASLITVIYEHMPMMEYELTDNLVEMMGTEASKVETKSPRKTSLEGQGQPEQWPPTTGRRGRQAIKSPRQSPLSRSPPLARSIKLVNVV